MKILFVCLGNICRSPTAEAVFREEFLQKRMDVQVDSAGTSRNHIGEKSDARSIKHAEKRGYSMTHLARVLEKTDFVEFDYILAMDSSNIENILKLCPIELRHKVRLLTDFSNGQYKLVPDPYYDGPEAFEEVIDIIESCRDGLVLHLKQQM